MEYFFYYLAVINVISLNLMGIDKYKAKKDYRRIKEKTIFFFALAGGSIGVLLGMKFFRHKTLKPKFYIGIPVVLILQIVITSFLIKTYIL